MTRARTRSHRSSVALALGLVLLAGVGIGLAGSRREGPDSRLSVEPQTRRGDVVSIFSGDITIPAGIEQRGSVVCLGGDVTIDGTVTGDVVVVMGTLELNGEVGGAVTGVLSELSLIDSGVGRELIAVAGGLTMERSTVGRELISVMNRLERDADSSVRGEVINVSPPWFPGIWAFLFWVRMVERLVIFVLILLIVAVAPERVRAIADDARERYVPAFFVGILAYLAFLVLLTLLSVTVIGIPLLWLAFWVMKWLGIAGLFAAIGRGLGRGLGREPSLLASVMLCFAIYILLTVVPGLAGLPGLIISGFFSFLFFLVVALPGVGLVVLTRGGRAPALPAIPPRPVADAGTTPASGAVAPPAGAPRADDAGSALAPPDDTNPAGE